jgi:hypothetical protein
MTMLDEQELVEEQDGAGPRRPSSEASSRRAWWIAGGLLAVGVVALLVGWATRNGDGSPAGTPTTTGAVTTAPAPTTTATTAAPTTVPTTPGAESSGLWPASGTIRFDDPRDAARSFATDVLHFRSPVVGDFLAGDTRSGEVPVRPRANGPETTVLVRQLGADDAWSVLAATTAHIDVATPTAGSELQTPIEVSGQAWAFEGTVQVEVRAGPSFATVGSGFVTGRGDAMGPFSGRIPFLAGTYRTAALVFFTESAENGEVWEATAIPVRLRTEPASAAACATSDAPHPKLTSDEMEVTVWFTCQPGSDSASTIRAVHRAVPRSAAALRASVLALLGGPSDDERAAAFSSWFSTRTQGMLRSVTISSAGHAVVDFADLRPVISGASSSAGSQQLLAELDATVFQFPSVRSVEYRIEGSCTAFNEWLQYGGCEPRARP